MTAIPHPTIWTPWAKPQPRTNRFRQWFNAMADHLRYGTGGHLAYKPSGGHLTYCVPSQNCAGCTAAPSTITVAVAFDYVMSTGCTNSSCGGGSGLGLYWSGSSKNGTYTLTFNAGLSTSDACVWEFSDADGTIIQRWQHADCTGTKLAEHTGFFIRATWDRSDPTNTTWNTFFGAQTVIGLLATDVKAMGDTTSDPCPVNASSFTSAQDLCGELTNATYSITV